MTGKAKLDWILDPVEARLRAFLNEKERQDLETYIIQNPDYQKDMTAAKKAFSSEFISAFNLKNKDSKKPVTVDETKLSEYADWIIENTLIRRMKNTKRFLLNREMIEKSLSTPLDDLASKLGEVPAQDASVLPKETLEVLYSQLETDGRLVSALASVAKARSLEEATRDTTINYEIKRQFPTKELFINYLEINNGLASLMSSTSYTRFEAIVSDMFNAKAKPELAPVLQKLKTNAGAIVAVWRRYLSNMSESKAENVYQ